MPAADFDAVEPFALGLRHGGRLAIVLLIVIEISLTLNQLFVLGRH